MIEAFSDMQAAGRQTPTRRSWPAVSRPRCAHTFLGLFLAVPCLAAFGMLRTMVDRLTVAVR